jgi:hypothetical protein
MRGTGSRRGLSAASPFPCRAGKNRVKISSDPTYGEKSPVIIDLSIALDENRGHGREPAGKAQKAPDVVALGRETTIYHN